LIKVDCQSHVFSQEYAEIILNNKKTVQISKDNDHYIVQYGELQQFKLTPEIYDPQRTILEMDQAGIDVSVISMNIPGPEMLDPELGVAAARVCNDCLAEICSRFKGRFVGLASLPLQDVDASISEFNRALDSLDLKGMILYSHIGGKPVDSPEFEPIYAIAERRRVPVVLHPTVPTWGSVIKDYSMIPMVGLMMDTSIAMLRLILSGVMENYPNLQVVHPHCGGVLPYLMPRIVEQTEVKGRGRDHIKKSPETYYKQVYFDLVSPSVQAMRYAYDFSGPDKLLFGSDRPWIKIKTFIDLIDRLDLSTADRSKLMGENAAYLFGIQ